MFFNPRAESHVSHVWWTRLVNHTRLLDPLQTARLNFCASRKSTERPSPVGHDGWVQNEDRRPKTQKRRPLQSRLEITLKWFERDYRPTQKQETARFAFINKFDQGLRFVHNPTKSTKRRPLQNRLEITSKWFERDCRPKQKQEATRFAVITTPWEIQDTYFQAVI